jgi:hypothetical protein
MNHNDESAALAHQQELEQRRHEEEQQLLRNDPYNRYIDLLSKLYGEHHAQH